MTTEQTIQAIISDIEKNYDGMVQFDPVIELGEPPFWGCQINHAAAGGGLMLRCGLNWYELSPTDYNADIVANAVYQRLTSIVTPSYDEAMGDAF